MLSIDTISNNREETLIGLKKRGFKDLKIIDKIIDEHDGIIFGSAGDSVIAEFSSPLKAAEAAVATQRSMKIMNQGIDEFEQMNFRVGINIGDVMVSDDNLFGDAVNIAARLEAEAKPAGICISNTVFDLSLIHI